MQMKTFILIVSNPILNCSKALYIFQILDNYSIFLTIKNKFSIDTFYILILNYDSSILLLKVINFL